VAACAKARVERILVIGGAPADRSILTSLLLKLDLRAIDGTEGLTDDRPFRLSQWADVVVLWWREDDGDLFDALTDALTSLAEDGVVWLLVPKTGRAGHVEPGDVTEVAPTAGLSQTSSISAAKDWSGIRLVTPKAARTRR